MIQAGCRVDSGPETVKQEGIKNFEDNIHLLIARRKAARGIRNRIGRDRLGGVRKAN